MIENDLRRFIVEELEGDGALITDDFPLIERDVVDSLGLAQLVSFVESQYDIEVGLEELVPARFGTIAAIARMVREKRAS